MKMITVRKILRCVFENFVHKLSVAFSSSSIICACFFCIIYQARIFTLVRVNTHILYFKVRAGEIRQNPVGYQTFLNR